MSRLFFVLSFIFVAYPVFAQSNYDYADSTELLLIYDEADTAAIEQLRQELNAVIVDVTPLTRIHLWKVPVGTIQFYGGPGETLNHAKGKAKIKGGELNYNPSLILELDDDEEDSWASTDPCFFESSFAYSSTNRAIQVAFLDTGIDGEWPQTPAQAYTTNHPEFFNRLYQNSTELSGSVGIDDDKNNFADDFAGWNFVDNNNLPLDINDHGSHTAGATAAILAHNNNSNVKLSISQTHDINGNGSLWHLVQGLDYAIMSGADVINLSVGYLSQSVGSKPGVIEYILDWGGKYKNVLFVAAAGNDGIDVGATVVMADGTMAKWMPASLPNANLIVVGALTCADTLAGFSNFGQNVSIAAPGVNIFSAVQGGNYAFMTGTSMAAPHVSAIAALEGTETTTFSWNNAKQQLLQRAIIEPGLQNKINGNRKLRFTESNSPMQLSGSITASSPLCNNNTVTLTANAVGGVGAYTYLWSTGATSQSINTTSAGIFSVSISAGTQVQVVSFELAELSVPPIELSTASTCSNFNVAVQNIQPSASYSWSNNAEGSSITPAQAGVYTVTMTLPNTCKATASVLVNNQTTNLSFSKDTICRGECTLLSLQGANLGNYQFSWSTGATSSSIQVCPSSSRSYTVTVVSTPNCVQIFEIPVLVRVTPNIQPLPSINACPCGQTVLNATANGGAGMQYSWSNGGLNGSIVNPSATTTYTVTATNTFGCSSSRSVTIAMACSTPTNLAGQIQNGNLQLFWNNPCTFNRLQIRWRCNSNSAWTIVNILSGSSEQANIVLPTICSNVQWQIRGRCCNNVFSKWSLVQSVGGQQRSVNAPIAYVYPNPVAHFLSAQDAQIVSISNMMGQIVLVASNPDAPLDVSSLVAGNYTVLLKSTLGLERRFFIKI